MDAFWFQLVLSIVTSFLLGYFYVENIFLKRKLKKHSEKSKKWDEIIRIYEAEKNKIKPKPPEVRVVDDSD